MSPEQLRYATTKAVAELAQDAADRRIVQEVPPVSRGMTDEELRTHAEAVTRIEAECHVWATRDAMLEAERALVAWVRAQVAALPQYRAHRGDMELVFANYQKYPKIREGLVRTCMQLREVTP